MPDLVPLIYLAIGALGGWVLAEARLRADIAEREAHAALTGERVIKAPEEFSRPRRRRFGWLREQGLLLAVLLIACYGAVQTSLATDDIQAQADANQAQGERTDELSECVKQQLLEYVVGAEEVREANRIFRLRIAELLNVSLDPDSSEARRNATAIALRDAANAVNDAYRDHPLPTEEDIKQC